MFQCINDTGEATKIYVYMSSLLLLNTTQEMFYAAGYENYLQSESCALTEWTTVTWSS